MPGKTKGGVLGGRGKEIKNTELAHNSPSGPPWRPVGPALRVVETAMTGGSRKSGDAVAALLTAAPKRLGRHAAAGFRAQRLRRLRSRRTAARTW